MLVRGRAARPTGGAEREPGVPRWMGDGANVTGTARAAAGGGALDPVERNSAAEPLDTRGHREYYMTPAIDTRNGRCSPSSKSEWLRKGNNSTKGTLHLRESTPA
ncbi:hypothetical protein Lesp02_35950 [Lentzea sp. NBRC 105346]|nr:hypothetical protein Lesp02_35950 [Lentzea sp. NBRC 105346]